MEVDSVGMERREMESGREREMEDERERERGGQLRVIEKRGRG